MRVAINGMGIAGPTLAYWLRRSGHDPVLFEKAPAVRSGGYLIDFWGLGYEIAERMGIISTLRERGYEMERLRMVDRDGREEARMDLTPLYEAQRGRFISVARADLAVAVAESAAVAAPEAAVAEASSSLRTGPRTKCPGTARAARRRCFRSSPDR